MQITGGIFGKISEKCANTSCSYSSKINTTVLSSIGEYFTYCIFLSYFDSELRWQEISPSRNEINSVWKAAKSDIRKEFHAHHSRLSNDALTASVVDIADNSTYDDLVNITEAVLEKMNAECKNGSCTYSTDLKSQVITTLGKRRHISARLLLSQFSLK